jgi:hypothetical protein
LTTNKPLGASQVTSIVRVLNRTDETCAAKGYSVSFTAELRSPYCVQLAQPLLLDVDELAEIKAISELGDIESWATFVECLRSRVVSETEWVQGTLDLGDVDQLLFADDLTLLGLPM